MYFVIKTKHKFLFKTFLLSCHTNQIVTDDNSTLNFCINGI